MPPVPLQLAPIFAISKPEPAPFLPQLKLLFLSSRLLQPTLLSTSLPSQQYATPPVPLQLAPTFAASKPAPAPFLRLLTPPFLSLQSPLPILQLLFTPKSELPSVVWSSEPASFPALPIL